MASHFLTLWPPWLQGARAEMNSELNFSPSRCSIVSMLIGWGLHYRIVCRRRVLISQMTIDHDPRRWLRPPFSFKSTDMLRLVSLALVTAAMFFRTGRLRAWTAAQRSGAARAKRVATENAA